MKEYTLLEVAQITGKKLRTVRSWVYSGKLPSHKDGRGYRRMIYEADLFALIRGEPDADEN